MNNTQISQYMCYEELPGQEVRSSSFRQRQEVLQKEFLLIEELIKLRVERNLTQTELAEKTGIKQTAIARLESGRANPTFMTLARIAEALDKQIAFV